MTISEFVRAKLKAWVMYGAVHLRLSARGLKRRSRRADRDAEDIVFALSRYWNRVDINRIPEQDMHEFVVGHKAVAPAWAELRRKYGL